jgi:hypothetical protein
MMQHQTIEEKKSLGVMQHFWTPKFHVTFRPFKENIHIQMAWCRMLPHF